MNVDVEKVTPKTVHSHSKYGIAAFITGLISLCISGSFLGLIFIGTKYSTNNFVASFMRTADNFFYVLFIAGSLFTLISFILGLVALFQVNQKKLFAVLAIIQLIFEVCFLLVLFLYLAILTTGGSA